MTVSFILNKKLENNGICRGVIEKIIKVSEEMKFMPNMIASLSTNRTKSIWMIIGDISNPFFSDLAKIIEKVCRLLEIYGLKIPKDRTVMNFDNHYSFRFIRSV